jgi:phycoerythrin-associated linker protein
LQQTIQTQAQTIAELKQRLANLQSLAGIGAAYLKNGWQPVSSPSPGIASDSSQQQASDQVAQIAALQAQIAETQSYATIGEARLNKWRNRSFNN